MVKKCPKCGFKNRDQAFWCENCKYRLVSQNHLQKTIYEENEFIVKETISPEDLDFKEYKKDKSDIKAVIKLLLIPVVIIFMLYAALYFSNILAEDIQNQGQGILEEIDWGKYDFPWGEDGTPWDYMQCPWTETLTMDDLNNPWLTKQVFTDVSEFGKDYWFKGDTIYTDDGWENKINKVKKFSYNAVILDMHVYSKDNTYHHATEKFSPIDIFFGLDDIYDNLKDYPYIIVRRYYRMVYVKSTGDTETNSYFMSHVTNTHLIPHNKQVFNTFSEIEVGDKVSISGYYVNVYGTRNTDKGTATFSWETDTEIGNHDCEVVLVDELIKNKLEP